MPKHTKVDVKPARSLRFAVIGAALLAPLLVLNALLAISNIRTVTAAEARAAHTQAARLQITGLLSAMKDAETGGRGFLITGKDSYLEPYRRAQVEVAERISAVSELIADSPEQQADLALARKLVDAKLAVLERALARTQADSDSQRGLEAARDLLRSGAGKAAMDQLRAVVARMEARAQQLFDAQEREVAARERTAMLTTLASLGFEIALVVGVLVAVRRQLSAIQERKRAESALRESEERLWLFVEHAPAAIAMFDRDMRYLIASKRWLADYGLGDRELRGTSHYDVFPEISADWKEVHQRALAGEVIRKEADQFRRADGTARWLRWEVRPWRDARGAIGGIIVFTEDITQLTRAAEEAREMAQWLRLAQSAASVGTWQWDLRTNENVWSDELWQLYGRAKGSCTPSYETWLEVIVPEDRGATERAIREAAERGADLSVEFRVRWPDGAVRHLLARAQPQRDGAGAPEKYVGIVIDITERKHAEEATRRAEQERALRELSARAEERERELRDAAEAGSAAKSEFLSSMSHELRTPLNAVLGFAQLLQRDRVEPLSARHRERVASIVTGGEHLLSLIDDVLDLSRIESGRVSISTEPVAVARVLDEIQQTLEPMAARFGVHVELLPLPAELPAVAADRTRLAQILLNLGSNAIKYNRPGGRVTFAVSNRDGARVRVTVRDTGFGIPLEKQGMLFQPFQRAGQEMGPIEGTGIGLVITRRLARLMRGDVGFSSTAGEGSEFWVDMPAHAAAPAPALPPLAKVEKGEGLAHRGSRRVLYIEDNPANVALMEDFVGTLDGVVLRVAATAEAGIETAHTWRPDLVIVDLNLPGEMSGYDALRALRSMAALNRVPVIALTAAASEHDKRRGAQAGFDRYVTKPMNMDELDGVFRTLLESAEAAAPKPASLRAADAGAG